MRFLISKYLTLSVQHFKKDKIYQSDKGYAESEIGIMDPKKGYFPSDSGGARQAGVRIGLGQLY